jgi:hypothetical protein
LSEGVRHFGLYRWDFELATSESAFLVALGWTLAGAAVFTVMPLAGLGFDYLGSSAHVQLLILACVGGPLAWLVYLIDGLPYWNWIEFCPDGIRFRRYLESEVRRNEVKELATCSPQYRLPYLIALWALASPTPFSSRWAIPPSGGYVLTLSRRRLGYQDGWFWLHRCVHFAPRRREGFHELLEEWWGAPIS